jgi:hypothetical protein
MNFFINYFVYKKSLYNLLTCIVTFYNAFGFDGFVCESLWSLISKFILFPLFLYNNIVSLYPWNSNCAIKLYLSLLLHFENIIIDIEGFQMFTLFITLYVTKNKNKIIYIYTHTHTHTNTIYFVTYNVMNKVNICHLTNYHYLDW